MDIFGECFSGIFKIQMLFLIPSKQCESTEGKTKVTPKYARIYQVLRTKNKTELV